MRAAEIKLDQDYQISSGWRAGAYLGAARARIVEQIGAGWWEAELIDDPSLPAHNRSKIGEVVTVHSREVLQSWSEAEAQAEQREQQRREWERAERDLSEQVDALVAQLPVRPTLVHCDLREDAAGLPAQSRVMLRLDIDQLRSLVAACGGRAAQQTADTQALAQLLI